MGCGASKSAAVTPTGQGTRPDFRSEINELSQTITEKSKSIKRLEERLLDEEIQRKNLDIQVRVLEEKLNSFTEIAKKSKESNTSLTSDNKTKSVQELESLIQEGQKKRNDLENKIAALEKKLDENLTPKAGRNQADNHVQISADLEEAEGHAAGNKTERNHPGERITNLEPRPPVLNKTDLILHGDQFTEIDRHARNVSRMRQTLRRQMMAPENYRTSVPDLVQYLCKTSTDPLLHVRAIFVWITNNVKYDADGFFGRSPKSPCDFQSVMRTGLSVCEGYANVMEAMCKQAAIEVRKISGFAKGYGHSAEQQLTTRHKTNHAWNAVLIKGNWFLLDATWGAGHLDNSGQNKTEFDEFYFLTDPSQFIFSHFPYMNGDIKESMKWQLLKQPLSLEKFDYLMRIRPNAFKTRYNSKVASSGRDNV